jgi:hypothetical protein
MASMKNVKTAVCEYEPLPIRDQPVTFGASLLNRQDFWILNFHGTPINLPALVS